MYSHNKRNPSLVSTGIRSQRESSLLMDQLTLYTLPPTSDRPKNFSFTDTQRMDAEKEERYHQLNVFTKLNRYPESRYRFLEGTKFDNFDRRRDSLSVKMAHVMKTSFIQNGLHGQIDRKRENIIHPIPY